MTINIGGDEVTEITIDGDAVTEVTADGDVVWTATTATVIDTFDDGDATEYSGATGNVSFVSSPARSGMAISAGTGSLETIHSFPGDGLDNYPAEGDTFEWWSRTATETDGGTVGAYFGRTGGDNKYEARLRLNDDDILLSAEVGGSFVASETGAFTATDATWYRNEIEWGASTVTYTVYDASDTQQATASISTQSLTDSGLSWLLNSGASSNTVYIDEAGITS